MIRGTTPVHTFQLPFDTGCIKSIKILYAQNGQVVLEKNTRQVQLQGSTATVNLSQEDTLAFSSADTAEIQLRILTEEGQALASGVIPCGVGRLLEDEVLE